MSSIELSFKLNGKTVKMAVDPSTFWLTCSERISA